MTTITAGMVKELRERTGAGMMECKKALQASSGDIEAAIDVLQISGQAKAAKRAGKIACAGIIVIHVDGQRRNACMVEINCETDFVARGEQFLAFTETVAAHGLKAHVKSVGELLQCPSGVGTKTIEQLREDLAAKLGENVQVRRVKSMHSDGLIGSYLHGSRIGVLLAITRSESELARDLAMHIAASSPQAIDADRVPAELVQREREIFTAQSKESGKPDNIIEKMISGRIVKFLKEVSLVDQPFVKDPDKTVGALLKAHQAQITDFARFEVGEGLQKETQDFVAEVKAQLKGS